MPSYTGDYGRGGRFGIGTPQGNPNVEDEFGILMPREVSLHTIRLTSAAAHPKDRLREYIQQLPKSLKRYDTLELDAFGFACTASSYLLDEAEEQKILETASKRFPIYTATQAIKWALQQLHVKRIIIAAPYPDYIREAAESYWAKNGFTVVDMVPIHTESTDTRSIYKLSSTNAISALKRMSLTHTGAVVLSGTGMPSLQAVAQEWPVPVLTSNLCLAAKMLQASDVPAAKQVEGIFINGWESRLVAAISKK